MVLTVVVTWCCAGPNGLLAYHLATSSRCTDPGHQLRCCVERTSGTPYRPRSWPVMAPCLEAASARLVASARSGAGPAGERWQAIRRPKGWLGFWRRSRTGRTGVIRSVCGESAAGASRQSPCSALELCEQLSLPCCGSGYATL